MEVYKKDENRAVRKDTKGLLNIENPPAEPVGVEYVSRGGKHGEKKNGTVDQAEVRQRRRVSYADQRRNLDYRCKAEAGSVDRAEAVLRRVKSLIYLLGFGARTSRPRIRGTHGFISNP